MSDRAGKWQAGKWQAGVESHGYPALPRNAGVRRECCSRPVMMHAMKQTKQFRSAKVRRSGSSSAALAQPNEVLHGSQ